MKQILKVYKINGLFELDDKPIYSVDSEIVIERVGFEKMDCDIQVARKIKEGDTQITVTVFDLMHNPTDKTELTKDLVVFENGFLTYEQDRDAKINYCYDEIGKLTQAVNELTARLEVAEAQSRQAKTLAEASIEAVENIANIIKEQ